MKVTKSQSYISTLYSVKYIPQ